ncbi:hypothetical protein HH304_05445 [Flammeovirgaceae bacterium KN852]|uniref:TraB family protein n=1 Tax=Marinigracilibium pacificum TaxID=2729599 RepID=A0A848IVX1_9BACT|nr:hypothetical protein [Marinigracilibium pacificum]
MKTPADFFPEEKAKVLVVGTFHFDYPGLDAHQIDEQNKIDVLIEPKKTEVTELVEYIKRFKPTKIAIEANENWEATKKLRKYIDGDYHDKRDERFQIGMRIASELGLDTLYSIDTETMAQDIEKIDSSYSSKLWKDYDFNSDDPMEKHMREWFKYNDEQQAKMNLLEYFKVSNSKESHNYGYGIYLIGDFKLDDQRGADILSYWWYNRNVRIFRKMQMITEGKNDRILLIFGNGHAAVLRQLIEASPEYEFVEFGSM